MQDAASNRLTWISPRLVNVLKFEWVLSHGDELQDGRCEVTTLNLRYVVFIEQVKCWFRIETKAFARALMESASPARAGSLLGLLGRYVAKRPLY